MSEQLEEEKYTDVGEIVPKANGATLVDPRQEICWKYYVESFVAGNPNISSSAVKAGFGEAYALKIGQMKWFKDKVKKLKRSNLLTLAERNLEDILNMSYTTRKMKDGEMYEEIDTDVLRIVLDTSKTVVKSLGKDEGYSERSEVTGKGGDPIVFMPAELLTKHKLN